MKIAHNLKISVFINEKDNEDEIKISLLSLLPYEEEQLEKEKIVIEEEIAELNLDRELKIYTIYLTHQRKINKVFEHIVSLFDEEQIKFLIDTLDSRLDSHCNLYFRLDKDKLNSGEVEFTDSGNCFHFRLNIAAFPSRKENAKKLIKEFFNDVT